MEVRVERETALALGQVGSLRCLLGIRYDHHDRHSVPVIAWARREAGEVSQNLLKGAGLDTETGNFTFVLNGIQLEKHPHRSYICYDLHLEKYSCEARERIDRSIRQPIHVITKRGDVFIARRAPKCDTKVALFLERFQKRHRIQRPFFHDTENPPLYRNGKRLEKPWVKDAEKNVENDATSKVEISLDMIVDFMFEKLKERVETQQIVENDIEEWVEKFVDNFVEHIIEKLMQEPEVMNIANDAVKKDIEKKVELIIEKLKEKVGAKKMVERLKEQAAAKRNGENHANKNGNNYAEEDEGGSRPDREGDDGQAIGAQNTESED
jgi:hypothetical protein